MSLYIDPNILIYTIIKEMIMIIRHLSRYNFVKDGQTNFSFKKCINTLNENMIDVKSIFIIKKKVKKTQKIK